VQAHNDFESARLGAFFSEVAALLRRRPNLLISFRDVQSQFPIEGQVYRGFQTVPVAAVRGSVDRYEDFSRNFLPRQSHTRDRWESVDRANLAGIDLPPIEVYKVGEIYFVKDGNHRVSVARQQGMKFIDALIVEVQTPVPLARDADRLELLRMAEYGQFLRATNLQQLRPGTKIRLTELGGYEQLLEHIGGHRWFLGTEYGRPFSWEEAVQSWHDTVYKPMVDLIVGHRIMHAFPGRTAADLYLWIVEHRYYLSLTFGKLVGGGEALSSFDREQLRLWRRVLRAAYGLYYQVLHTLSFLSPLRLRSRRRSR
jgi:hypothetical protein